MTSQELSRVQDEACQLLAITVASRKTARGNPAVQSRLVLRRGEYWETRSLCSGRAFSARKTANFCQLLSKRPTSVCMCNGHQKPEFDCIPFWLLIAALSLALTTRYASAAGETRPADQQTVSTNATPPGFPARITTLNGKTYEKVILEKVDPDGLLVLFTPVEGGSGAAKLKFQNLPSDLRQRYGYDPDRVSDYEVAQARGAAVWLARSTVWAEQKQAAQAEQAAWERQMRAEAESRRATAEEQARAEAARNVQQQPTYYYPGWWNSGIHNSFPRHHRVSNHIPRQIPTVGITSSPISPHIGPMRPLGR